MREAFESEAAQTGKDRLLITMAVPASLEYAEKGFDVESLNYDLDFFNLLTYDYHSSYEPGRTTKPVTYVLLPPFPRKNAQDFLGHYIQIRILLW